jgi:nucleoside-diphosphate-sugar epimerase
MPQTVVLTGAAGNIGSKLRSHLEAKGDCALRLIDRAGGSDAAIVEADLGQRDSGWSACFAGADVVVHLAGNGDPGAEWADLVAPNVDGVVNLYLAARDHGVSRVVLASSVWAMAARRADRGTISAAAPAPGDSRYGASKLFAEQLAPAFWRSAGISTVILRLGHCAKGINQPVAGERWDDECWLSNRDLCDGLDRALRSERPGVSLVNLTSRNGARRWTLDEARAILGYVPRDAFVPDAPWRRWFRGRQ